MGCPLIIMTGRTEPFRDETLKWLRLRGLTPRILYMRAKDDRRKNVIVKQEMMSAFLLQHQVKQSDILCVFEDRDEIVAMWRSLGYVCLQPRPSVPAPLSEATARREGQRSGWLEARRSFFIPGVAHSGECSIGAPCEYCMISVDNRFPLLPERETLMGFPVVHTDAIKTNP
jgi:hypothetical protein